VGARAVLLVLVGDKEMVVQDWSGGGGNNIRCMLLTLWYEFK